MSREIKFQYMWKRENKIALGVYDLKEIENGLAKAPRSRDGSRMTDWECVARRQYTGLKDKNGVEIYEGDIVMCYPDEIELCYTKVVEWDENSPNLGITTNGRSGATLCRSNQDVLLVIGNIHQNPELLQ